MSKNIKWARSKIMLFVAFLGLIVVIGANYFIYWKLSSASAQLQALNLQISENQGKKNELDTLNRNFKSTMEQRDRLMSVFLRSAGVADFLQTLEEMVKKSGLTGEVKSIEARITDEYKDTDKEVLIVHLEAQGKMEDAEKLLTVLENLSYKSYVSQFDLSVAKNTDKKDSKTPAPLPAEDAWTVAITLETVKFR